MMIFGATTVVHLLSEPKQQVFRKGSACSKHKPSPTRAIILEAIQEATMLEKVEKLFLLCADEVSTYTSEEKSAFLAKGIKLLVTNVKDEPNVAEFVVHHLLLGFDHVIVLDDHSNVIFDPVKEIADSELWERGKMSTRYIICIRSVLSK